MWMRAFTAPHPTMRWVCGLGVGCGLGFALKRHAESQGNVDARIYSTAPDYEVGVAFDYAFDWRLQASYAATALLQVHHHFDAS